MAKSRMVNTRFWIDDYISNLDPIEKLLFLYFLTNPSTDISGVYEIPLKTIAVDTGIEKEMVIKILRRFKRDKKVFYEDGWVGIKNFSKHQNLNNSQIAAGVEAGLNKAPKSLKDRMKDESSGVMDESSHLNPNPNLNPDPNTNVAEPTLRKDDRIDKNIIAIIDAFHVVNPSYRKFFGNKTQRKSCEKLAESHGLEVVLKVVAFLPKSNVVPFTPVITTPLQLEDKWAALEVASKRVLGKEKNYVI